MIHIHETKRTNSIIINSEIFDALRRFDKVIKIFGITIMKRSLSQDITYTQAVLERKQIGLLKQTSDEKTESKAQ